MNKCPDFACQYCSHRLFIKIKIVAFSVVNAFCGWIKRLVYSNTTIFRPNRKMSQSELSSVGSDSPGNSGNDERGSLIGDRGRTLQRTRTLGRNSSSGKGSRIGGEKDADAAGDYPTARVPLLNHLNLWLLGYYNMD